jgi:hypothetical protein
MIGVRLICPRCGNKERMPITDPMRIWEDVGSQRKQTVATYGSSISSCAAACPNCFTPFGVLIKPRHDVSVGDLFKLQNSTAIDAALEGGLVKTYPAGADAFSPNNDLPEKIRKAFVFAQEDAARGRNPAGVMAGARGCLDVALKELGEETGGRRERINNLSANGTITTGIATWAQTLWEEGSDAVHDLDATIERAREHVEFLELFFEVAFVLPAKIERASHIANEDGAK